MRRVVRVGVGLPRHDREVHGVITDDDAVLDLRVCRRVGERVGSGIGRTGRVER